MSARSEKYLADRVSRETKLSHSASLAPARAHHAGVAAGITAGRNVEGALDGLLLGFAYRGERLRSFAEGVRVGLSIASAVAEVTQ